MRRIANHGQIERYHHVEIGTNSRLDSLQAAVLNCACRTLDDDNARRRALAADYRERLAGVGDLRFPADRPEDEVVYHQLTIATARRDALAELPERARRRLVDPLPVAAPPPGGDGCDDRAAAGAAALPVAERAAREVLCLPMFAELDERRSGARGGRRGRASSPA